MSFSLSIVYLNAIECDSGHWGNLAAKVDKVTLLPEPARLRLRSYVEEEVAGPAPLVHNLINPPGGRLFDELSGSVCGPPCGPTSLLLPERVVAMQYCSHSMGRDGFDFSQQFALVSLCVSSLGLGATKSQFCLAYFSLPMVNGVLIRLFFIQKTPGGDCPVPPTVKKISSGGSTRISTSQICTEL